MCYVYNIIYYIYFIIQKIYIYYITLGKSNSLNFIYVLLKVLTH
jgi:hypothetical protein